MPSGSTAQVARPAAIVAVSDDRRSQRSATVNRAIAKLGPALLTNGVNRTPTSVAAMQTTATETTVATGHLPRQPGGSSSPWLSLPARHSATPGGGICAGSAAILVGCG